MDKILITGVGGLVGSAAAEHFHRKGLSIIGVDNDLRGTLLGDPQGSTRWNVQRLSKVLRNFSHHELDVRDKDGMEKLVRQIGPGLKGIVHCAAQTAHEGAVLEDFSINTVATLNLLDLWRRHSPQAVFAYMSTIKVYGSFPNTIEYHRGPTRYDRAPSEKYFQGFDEGVSIDQGMSSFFGRSKTAADLYVQEFCYQHGLKGACFRASCLTGGNHSGTEAHGMLSYLMRCVVTGTPYRIYGYEGLQVRDQLHADDLISAIDAVITKPSDNIVYNIGGGRENACSVLEAISMCEEIAQKRLEVSHHEMRKGDHRWWVTDNGRLQKDYPSWRIKVSLRDVLQDIYDKGKVRWAVPA